MAIHRCRKPTIGALNGSAVGIGITMTLPMTIRIAYKDAKVGFVFARRGLVMEAASSYFLPRLIGMSKTMHIITTGATYPANHKLLDGLFSETLDTPAEVLPRALAIASDYVANCSSVSYGLMHALLWHQEDSPEKQHLLDSRILYHLYDSADIKEGVASFMEKRPVNFKGTLSASRPPNYPWWGPVDINPRTQGKL
jgi:enoyl-CoA hydratase/carnithine racemase